MLGRAFLQEAYLIVDWEQGSLNISQTVHNPTEKILVGITSTDGPASSSRGGLSSASIAGLVVGLIAIVALIAGISAFLWHRKRTARERKHSILAPTIDTIETLGTGTLVDTEIMSETASCRKNRLDSGASELPEECRDHELGSRSILEMEGDKIMPETDKEKEEQQGTPVEREPSVHELA